VSKNWNDGLALCARFNMSLATFDNAADASYLQSLGYDGPHWVGVFDTLQKGVYKNYNDGKIVTSALTWQQGQPNNAGGAENCIHIESNGYADSNCNRYYRVICELNLPNDPVVLVENLVEVLPPSTLFQAMGESRKFDFFASS
jgi:hypothetical protein